jgi:hypothetical protein
MPIRGNLNNILVHLTLLIDRAETVLTYALGMTGPVTSGRPF